MNIPNFVQSIILDLAVDETVSEIWLIGSQASETATEKSDWDLLVFSSQEPKESARRSDFVDVLWKGPNGNVLAEGMSKDYMLNFSDFQWEEGEYGKARYRGRRFNDFPEGVVRNSNEPLQYFTKCVAVRLWSRIKREAGSALGAPMKTGEK